MSDTPELNRSVTHDEMEASEQLSEDEYVVTAVHEAGHCFVAHVVDIRIDWVRIEIGKSNFHRGQYAGRTGLLPTRPGERKASSGKSDDATNRWFLRQSNRWLYGRLLQAMAGPVVETLYTGAPFELDERTLDGAITYGLAQILVVKQRQFPSSVIEQRAAHIFQGAIKPLGDYLYTHRPAISDLASFIAERGFVPGSEIHAFLTEKDYPLGVWQPALPDLRALTLSNPD